jgi:chromosome segregation protein
MYLRQLAILGFKSFATKTELNFPRGVAAVVGPNGCGKSNVLDAIRWALGEQSAKALRGSEMADVIFNGADTRAAIGVAEVSLTFGDCEAELGTEYSEVCITRRVYRDGRGEYLLNRAHCRLRDIQELFMDTGIGRSAYSIMEQGKIDLILSARPEDRRAVFEEAAGITKYKSQRREAARKLEQTEANLARLTDVIGEVKRQLGSLQRQAAKARRHQAISADLRVLETHLGHAQFTRFDQELKTVSSELTVLRAEQARLEEELQGGEARLGEERAALEAVSARLQEARQAAQEARDKLQGAINRREFNAERAAQSEDLLARCEAEAEAAEEKLKVQEEQLVAADEEQRQIFELVRAGQQRLFEQEKLAQAARSKRMAAEQALQLAQRGAAEADHRLGQLGAELNRFYQREQADAVRVELLATELARLAPGREQAEERLAEVRDRVTRAAAVVAERRDAMRAAEQAVAPAQQELAEADRALAAAQRAVSERTARLEVLRQSNEAGAGLASGTQAVLRGLDQPALFKPAIAGVMATLMEVEPRFIPAVEALLGRHLQAVLVKDPEIAAVLLGSLAREKKVGRATLAVLAQETAPSEAGPLPAGALAWAAGAVTFSPAAAPIAGRLLADCVIAETLEAAHGLRAADPGLTVATLAGEVLDRNGFWHAGAGGEGAQGVLVRQGQIKKLAAEAAEEQERAESLTASRAAAAEAVQAAAETLSEARQQLQAAQMEASTLQNQLGLHERESRDLAARFASLEKERQETERRAETARQEAQGLEKRREEKRLQLEQFDSEKAAAAERADACRAEEQTLNEGLSEARVRVATEQQRQEGLRRQRQPMDARRAELAELIASRRSELDAHRANIERCEAEAAELETRIETSRAIQDTAAEQIAARHEEQTAAARSVEALDAALRACSHALSAAHERRAGLEVREAQLLLRLENLCEHTAQRYQLDLRAFEPEPPALHALCARLLDTPAEAETPLDAIETLARGLRERLDGIGAVNVDAIAEYDSLEARYNFLETQNADLINARKELLGMIATINETSRALFAETFERVRVNFQEMYQELFGGGRADLLLANAQDPLECGIEIIARPPGKQLQSVTLLSGGEKTMTAVALLFAIYMVKPSPFCVLDEMDAPLDESNISRFLAILDRFIGQSQFIVITHNKRTIARADVLYGITMEEAGVSKVVAVRLASRESEPGQQADLIGTKNDTVIEAAHHDAEAPSIAQSFGKSGELQGVRAD